MTNTESFTHIDNAIKNTDVALALFDSLSERVPAAQETVAALEADVAALQRNDAALDAKVRANKFTVANSALVLAQSDLKQLQAAVSAQKTKTVAIGKAAVRALLEIRDLLRIQRQANVVTWLKAQFDFSQIPGVTAPTLANEHQSVRTIESLGVSNLFYEVQHRSTRETRETAEVA